MLQDIKKMKERGEKSRDWQQGERKTGYNQNMFVACGPETVHECKHKVLLLLSSDPFRFSSCVCTHAQRQHVCTSIYTATDICTPIPTVCIYTACS